MIGKLAICEEKGCFPEYGIIMERFVWDSRRDSNGDDLVFYAISILSLSDNRTYTIVEDDWVFQEHETCVYWREDLDGMTL